MPTSIIIILLILLLLGLALAIFLLLRQKSDSGRDILVGLTENLNLLRAQNQELQTMLDQRLQQTHEAGRAQQNATTQIMQDISKQSAKYLSEVTQRLTKLDETNQQVINFSSQLQNLQDILKNPKQRGVLGEFFLEETLKNVLPPNSYQMQYKFQNGEIVDAAVFVKEKVIPIDSKFSLENYEKILQTKDAETRAKLEKQFRQDLKTRIDETAKYIRPSENTMDFAFMFIPSEAIYYDLLVNKVGAVQVNTRDLIEYAFNEKHVIIVSPTSFLAYLQTVLQGLRALQIEESAKQIRANVEKLGRHILAYDEYYKKLGVSLGTTVNHYNAGYKELNKIDKDVVKITDGQAKIEPLSLDKPSG